MPGFDPIELKDEEKVGGFEPGEEGDDTFHLESLPAYPDVDGADSGATEETPAPVFESETDGQEPAQDPNIDESAPPEEDLPFLEPTSAAEAVQSEELDEEAVAEDLAAAYASAANESSAAEEEAPTSLETEQNVPDKTASEEAAETPVPEDAPDETDVAAEDPDVGLDESPADDESVALDPGLLEMIQGDLAKSKERAEQKDANADATDEEQGLLDKSELPDDVTLPSENLEDAIEVDVSRDIPEAHPTEFTPQDETEQAPAVEETTTASKKSKKKNVDKKSEKKRKIPLVAVIVGAVVLLAALASGTWMLMPVFFGSGDSQIASNGDQSDTLSTSASEDPDGAGETGGDTDTPAESPALDTRTGGDTTTVAAHDTVDGDAAATAQSEGSGEGLDTLANVDSVSGTIAESTNESTVSEAEQPPIRAGAQADPPDRTTQPVQSDIARLRQAENSVPRTIQSAPKAPPSARGEFVVQIYSSPSLDDANDWLHRLWKRNVEQAFISTQSIKDRVWYRVRFGPFPTQAAAQEKARELGFSKAWIVRIR